MCNCVYSMFEVIKVANNIKKARISAGLTQDELAAKLGTTRQNISLYENAKTEPKLLVWQKMASALHTSVAYLQGTVIYQTDLVSFVTEQVATDDDFWNVLAESLPSVESLLFKADVPEATTWQNADQKTYKSIAKYVERAISPKLSIIIARLASAGINSSSDLYNDRKKASGIISAVLKPVDPDESVNVSSEVANIFPEFLRVARSVDGLDSALAELVMARKYAILMPEQKAIVLTYLAQMQDDIATTVSKVDQLEPLKKD